MDETQSEEMAFKPENNNADTFKFDEVKAEEVTDSASQEDKQSDVGSEEPERVPYSRFKRVASELEERESQIASLEQRLTELEESRQESNRDEELEVPREWIELYGDSDVSKRAFRIQTQREERLQEEAVQRALAQFKEEKYQEEEAVVQNEGIIDDELAALQEQVGRKITPQVEEEILSIVDEFSPVGRDGKYVSLFPFDKAYEIYELRNQKVQNRTQQARNQVADLTGNSSQGEADSSEAPFQRGWDNWRKEL